MHQRHFIRNTVILSSAGVLFQKNLLAQMFNVPQSKITMLRGGVGMFTERGGTIGFAVSKEGIVVIDSQFPDTATNFINEIKKNKYLSSTLPSEHASSW